jgi:hypothetical protein
MKRALSAGALYFAAVFVAGFALGVVRTLWLAPALGAIGAVAVELPVMLGVSWLVSARILRRAPMSGLQAEMMGATAFVLLMLAEAGLSVLLAGRSLGEHLALYREPAHQLGLLGQLAFAGIPLLQAWLARRPA